MALHAVSLPSGATLTNATLWMALAVLGIITVFVLGSQARALVPGRMQSLGEMAYDFVHNMVEDVAGHDGAKYFPMIMTLFLFILFSWYMGWVRPSGIPLGT